MLEFSLKVLFTEEQKEDGLYTHSLGTVVGLKSTGEYDKCTLRTKPLKKIK